MELDDVYARIPVIECVKGCHECFGSYIQFRIEYKNIMKFLGEHNIREKFARQKLHPAKQRARTMRESR